MKRINSVMKLNLSNGQNKLRDKKNKLRDEKYKLTDEIKRI
jgi:hypothetical protein